MTSSQISEIVFMVLAALTLFGGLLAVALKNVFYNALALILCLFGVAGIFIYLQGEFLAVMEVIVYIGAISIAIIFAIMLSRPMFQKHIDIGGRRIFAALGVSGLLFLGVVRILRRTHWNLVPQEGDYSIDAIGRTLLSQAVLPFEAISLILLVAIIGAFILSDKKGGASK